MSSPKRILLVDDSNLILSLHSNILKKGGYECSTAENGMLALEICLKHSFDLILTDINMPKMDGYEFTKQIRTQDSYANIPIIMLSTEQETRDKTRGLDAGANLYIVKPVDAETLMIQVNLLLGIPGNP